jgi:hypothetical protein
MYLIKIGLFQTQESASKTLATFKTFSIKIVVEFWPIFIILCLGSRDILCQKMFVVLCPGVP